VRPPLGDAIPILDRLGGTHTLGGIPPFGPSAWPPRATVSPLRGAPFLGGGSVAQD